MNATEWLLIMNNKLLLLLLSLLLLLLLLLKPAEQAQMGKTQAHLDSSS